MKIDQCYLIANGETVGLTDEQYEALVEDSISNHYWSWDGHPSLTPAERNRWQASLFGFVFVLYYSFF